MSESVARKAAKVANALAGTLRSFADQRRSSVAHARYVRDVLPAEMLALSGLVAQVVREAMDLEASPPTRRGEGG